MIWLSINYESNYFHWIFFLICVSQCLILQQTGGVSLPSVSRWRECPPLKSLSQTWLSRSLWPPRCTAGEQPWFHALQKFKKTLEKTKQKLKLTEISENPENKWEHFHDVVYSEKYSCVSDDRWREKVDMKTWQFGREADALFQSDLQFVQKQKTWSNSWQ